LRSQVRSGAGGYDSQDRHGVVKRYKLSEMSPREFAL
jgi:hypothetical protein